MAEYMYLHRSAICSAIHLQSPLMASPEVPTTMQAWQYHVASGTIENDLKLNKSTPVPRPKSDDHLVRILATAINPLDYKPVEAPFAGRFLVKRPAIPGFDIVARIIKPAAGSQLVLRQTTPSLLVGLPSS